MTLTIKLKMRDVSRNAIQQAKESINTSKREIKFTDIKDTIFEKIQRVEDI